jgi:hypothetical protein
MNILTGPVSLSDQQSVDGSKVYIFGDEHRMEVKNPSINQFILDLDKSLNRPVTLFLETPHHRLQNGKLCTNGYYICNLRLALAAKQLKHLTVIPIDIRSCHSRFMELCDSLHDPYATVDIDILREMLTLIENESTDNIVDLFVRLIDIEHVVKADLPIVRKFKEFILRDTLHKSKDELISEIDYTIKRLELNMSSISIPFIPYSAFVSDLVIFSLFKENSIIYVGEAHANALRVFLEIGLNYKTTASSEPYNHLDPYGLLTINDRGESPQAIDLTPFKLPFFQ